MIQKLSDDNCRHHLRSAKKEIHNLTKQLEELKMSNEEIVTAEMNAKECAELTNSLVDLVNRAMSGNVSASDAVASLEFVKFMILTKVLVTDE